MNRITQNKEKYLRGSDHICAVCHIGDTGGCTAVSCDGCVILEMYRALAAIEDYAESITDIVSLSDDADINDYIRKLDAVIRRHKPMKPKTDGLDEQDIIKCPTCGDGLLAADDNCFPVPKYCPECGQRLQWEDIRKNHGKSVKASRCPAIRIESEDLDVLASELLSKYMCRDIRARYCQDDYENPNYWGLRVDQTPLSKDEIKRLFDILDVDDDARDSTDFGEYPIVEICKSAAEYLINQALPFTVDWSIGCTHGVWFFSKTESVDISLPPESE